MKIATWNVNSLNVRLPHVLDWLASEQPDVLCLQETKLEDNKFPLEALQQAGYQAAFSGQKTYNGVAIISRHALHDVSYGIDGFDDAQKRLISATINDVRIICAYIPNGQSVDSDKYQYKLNWLTALQNQLNKALATHPQLALLGDYNIAPEDRDCYDPEGWRGQVLVSEPERAAFSAMQALPLHDAFRLFDQDAGLYSWWDYRMAAFRRNMGLRIDHILVSDALKTHCQECRIDKTPRKWERPSDHTPVVLTLDI